VIYRNWRAFGTVGGEAVEVALSETGRLMFGKCGCRFFADNLLNLGPCAHMLALLEASEEMRRDGTSSVESSKKNLMPRPPQRDPAAEEPVDEEPEDEG